MFLNPFENGPQLERFSSYEELVEFLKLQRDPRLPYRPGVREPLLMSQDVFVADKVVAATPEYSATNVQVAGVDEAEF